MKIYISGAISNDPHYRDHFAEAEDFLIRKGHTPINPAKLSALFPDLSYEAYLDADLAILKDCDGIYMLQGWEQSHGAKLEYLVALKLEKVLIFEA